KNWQVMRPIEVSMTTVGPLGTMLAAAVACGASGSGSCAGGVDCWPGATDAKANAANKEETRKTFLNIMPNSRVNHRTERLPAGTEPRPQCAFAITRACIVLA